MEHNGSSEGDVRPSLFELDRDAWGRLVLIEADGRRHAGVELVRAFPLSDPQHGIALCAANGHEILWIDDMDEVPAPLRRRIEEELAHREFVPVIRRVLRVSAPVEPSEWEVETDRGRTRFVLNNEDDVHELGGNRALLTDAHGIRYLIRDIEQLDAHSRRLLERYL